MTEKRIIGILCGITAASLLFLAGYFMGGRSKGEGLILISSSPQSQASADTRPVAQPAEGSAEADGSSLPAALDLNTATLEELCTLPGIGKSTAEKIIAYRESNGGFLQKEELLQVDGIGEKKYDALKELVAVDPS